ncbi:MAG TPA: hypothetical protein DEV93_11060, partial [Chloroflexi bacterium]|nr:hypothetical protein [Chloroflexota bacterium]
MWSTLHPLPVRLLRSMRESIGRGLVSIRHVRRQHSERVTTMTMPRLLDAYESMSVEEAILMCRDLVEDPDFPTVKKWRDAGGKVVGHFQVYFPEEIVHAAGMLPFKVRGAPVEARQGESHFGSYLCSILKTSLELALSGRVTLDMFVSHPICDSARNLAAVFGRNFEYPCEILYLPQNANSAHASTYLRG